MSFSIQWLENRGVTAPQGFRAGAARAAIKTAGDDVALLVAAENSSAAAVFTTNQVKAAPVLVSAAHLASYRARAIIVNAGNANCCTGARGLENARQMATLAARKLGIAPEQVLVCSTGIIGHQLPLEKIAAALDKLQLSGEAESAIEPEMAAQESDSESGAPETSASDAENIGTTPEIFDAASAIQTEFVEASTAEALTQIEIEAPQIEAAEVKATEVKATEVEATEIEAVDDDGASFVSDENIPAENVSAVAATAVAATDENPGPANETADTYNASEIAEVENEATESAKTQNVDAEPESIIFDQITAETENQTAEVSVDEAVARAFMTTDTMPKFCAAQIEIGGKLVTVGGHAKGVGMIGPDMAPLSPPALHATLLAFLTTDAQIERGLLQKLLERAVARSFNSVTVDGDMSTNDTAILLASGASDCQITEQNAPLFSVLLDAVCIELGKKIARDGEGATKLIEIRVKGARRENEAKTIALAIANSPLVKTAIFGKDPNWGRIAMAAGKAGVDFDARNLSFSLGEIELFRSGEPLDFDIQAAEATLEKEDVCIALDLSEGSASWTAWTCDFSYDYVKINAEYHT